MSTDSWFVKRVMTLTPFERGFMNSPHHARHTERTALALFEHIELPPQPRCLEIGCGQGALARLLVEHFGAQVIATDYDPEQVAVAQEQLVGLDEQIELRVVDARAMPFGEAEFDAVFSFGVLHHILSGWREAVAETARVLTPDGWFIFTDLVASAWIGRLTGRLLPRWDLLEEAALHACLAEHDLHLKHFKHSRGTFLTGLGLMAYGAGVARKTQSTR